MIRINRREIKNVSLAFANIFRNYEAYDLFFKDKDRKLRQIYYFYRFEIYVGANYTYKSDDGLCFATVKLPDDADRSVVGLFANPAFLLPFLFVTGIRANLLAGEYMRFAQKISEKYYDPARDCYIKNIGVDAEARGQGRLKEMIRILCGDAPIYLETHDRKNVEIYRHLGFEICEAADFHGYTHYAMKRN